METVIIIVTSTIAGFVGATLFDVIANGSARNTLKQLKAKLAGLS